jgi:hypothetical protein
MPILVGGNGEKTHRHTHGRRRQQARAADLSQPRVIGWQVEAHSPAWLAAASASPPRQRETDKSRVAAARSLRLRPRQTRPERLPSRDGRFETRENYNRLFSAPECRLWVIRVDLAISAICPLSGPSRTSLFDVANVEIGVIQAPEPEARIRRYESRTLSGLSSGHSFRIGRAACRASTTDESTP